MGYQDINKNESDQSLCIKNYVLKLTLTIISTKLKLILGEIHVMRSKKRTANPHSHIAAKLPKVALTTL